MDMPWGPFDMLSPEQRSTLLDALIVNVTQYAVVGIRNDGTINLWNRGAEVMFRYRVDEILDHPGDILFTPEDRAASIAQRELEFAREHGFAENRRWHLRKDGSRVWAEGRVVALRDERGEHIGYAKWMEDQSARHATDEALRLAGKKQDEFVGHAAHDIRAPLRTINGLLEMFLEDHGEALPTDGRKTLERARDAAQRLDRLVSSFLTYAEVGEYRPVLAQIDLNAVVDAVLPVLQADIVETGAVVVRESLPVVRCDALMLSRVFQNLIDNALLHARGAQPFVRVGCMHKGECWELRVEDNGPGVPEPMRETIFEPLKKGGGRGSGLGLSICRRIVRVHGGRMWVEDSPLGGASFRFTLPVEAAAG